MKQKINLYQGEKKITGIPVSHILLVWVGIFIVSVIVFMIMLSFHKLVDRQLHYLNKEKNELMGQSIAMQEKSKPNQPLSLQTIKDANAFWEKQKSHRKIFTYVRMLQNNLPNQTKVESIHFNVDAIDINGTLLDERTMLPHMSEWESALSSELKMNDLKLQKGRFDVKYRAVKP